jgi:hypothetical protein
MVAFHKEFRISLTIAVDSMLRNKIPETLKLGCLCNGMKTSIMTTNFTRAALRNPFNAWFATKALDAATDPWRAKVVRTIQ